MEKSKIKIEIEDIGDPKKTWFNFMASNNWAIFMNVMRILTFIMIAFLIFYMIREIEAVKLLMYDPCKICMSKTGCSCFCSNFG